MNFGIGNTNYLKDPYGSSFSSKGLNGWDVVGMLLGGLLTGNPTTGSGSSSAMALAKEATAIAIAGAVVGSKVIASLLSDSISLITRNQDSTQTSSKTIWKGKEGRIDVENPNPTQRPGQIHFQPKGSNEKYIYDAVEKTFKNAPKWVNELLEKPGVQKKIEYGLKILGLD